MKKYILSVFALLSMGLGVYASDGKFSLELGTGLQPLHMTAAPSYKEKEALAELGQLAIESGSFCPVLSLSAVWHVSPHWEMCATGGLSWKHFEYNQYPVFGTGPSGEPRYDLSKGQRAGWKASKPVPSLTAQARFIWSPEWAVTVYSALGLGLTTVTDLIPMPEVTPIAFRFGKDHFYTFAEATIGPVATFAHIGFGWKF